MQLSKSSQTWAAEKEARNVNIIRFLCMALMLSLVSTVVMVWVFQFKSPETIYIDRWFAVNQSTGVIQQYGLLEDIPMDKGDAKIMRDVQDYVTFREHYNYFPLQWAADRTFAMSAPDVADEYEIEANKNLEKFKKDVTATVHIESVVQTNDWTVNVRFTKTVKSKTGQESTTEEIAIVTFEYQDTIRLELPEKNNNYLGFQVTSYVVIPQDIKR